MFAAMQGHLPVVEYLEERVANIDTQDNKGTAPIHPADVCRWK